MRKTTKEKAILHAQIVHAEAIINLWDENFIGPNYLTDTIRPVDSPTSPNWENTIESFLCRD